MEIGLSDLVGNEQVLFALAAVLCAICTAAGLRLYQRDFHGRGDGETDIAVLAAVCSAGASCGLYFAGSETIAGLIGLVQSACVCVYIIRDLRRLASRNKLELRRNTVEITDIKAQLAVYMSAFQEQATRLADVEQSQRQLSRMRIVADNLSQGVALFDAQRRLVYSNERYRAIHNLSRDSVREGVAYEDILSNRVANGEFPGQPLESVEGWDCPVLAGRTEATSIFQYEDGRTIESTFKLLAGGQRMVSHADVTDLRATVIKSAQGALSDALTGLPGRGPFIAHIDAALARMKRSGAPLAVLMLDIDHFRAVNDSLGLEIGDKLLQLVAERLRELMRTTDVIARLRGDRFAILADTMREDRDAAMLAERVMRVLAVPYLIDGHQIDVTASVGISIAPNDTSDTETLLDNASIALKRAKDDGRSTCRFFEGKFDARMKAQRSLEADLRTGLARGELELYYQPVLDIASREISGLEALVRWHHPERGLLLPEAFLSLAEECGLMHPIGRWVAREACAAAARWPQQLKVIVNVSRTQLADREFVSIIENALASARLSAERLEIDVPESAVTQHDAQTLRMLAALREMGTRIALDDFGVGYAPLTYLQSFPFDKIKIGCALTASAQEPMFLLRAVATLAEGLRVETTAKRIETPEQLEMVLARRYTEAQGFLISPPMPAQDVETFLAHFNPKVLSGWVHAARA